MAADILLKTSNIKTSKEIRLTNNVKSKNDNNLYSDGDNINTVQSDTNMIMFAECMSYCAAKNTDSETLMYYNQNSEPC